MCCAVIFEELYFHKFTRKWSSVLNFLCVIGGTLTIVFLKEIIL